MLAYCETEREGEVFAILDPLPAQSVNEIITFAKTTNSLFNATEHAAIFYPELVVQNPNKAVYGPDETLTIPPSGVVAGVFVRTDTQLIGGIHQQPAGLVRGRLLGVLGTPNNEAVKKKGQRDLLYQANINPLWKDDNTPLHIGGVAVLNREGNWPSIAERRGVSYIVKSVRQSLPLFLFDNIDADLLERIYRSVDSFLRVETRNGAFASKDPSEAFFVDTGEAVNPRSQWRLRRTRVLMGLAKASPNEFIEVLVTRDLRAEGVSIEESL
jgi:phage tail sheath protein FI